MSSDPPADIYRWLLSERAACPACGGDLAFDPGNPELQRSAALARAQPPALTPPS